jgi:hypothetical protein
LESTNSQRGGGICKGAGNRKSEMGYDGQQWANGTAFGGASAASGTTVRQLNVSPFQVSQDGTVRAFDKVLVIGA